MTTTAPSELAIESARQEAIAYRDLGWQPLPSKMHIKGPMLSTFADFWGRRLPEATYSRSDWRTTNIQIMCGIHWKLFVVDCDGDEAKDTFAQMCGHFGGIPHTWVTATGGGGEHYYFTTPDWLDEIPSRRLWGVWDTWGGTRLDTAKSPPKGDWQKHKEIRILGERSLAIAPPSIHVTTGRQYAWKARPGDRPAVAPSWLIAMPGVEPPAPDKLPRPAFTSDGPRASTGTSYRREQVLAAVPSKIDIARRWGLRVASAGPNPKGWWNCFAIDRDEDNPSSSFHDTDGVYWCGREKRTISLFDFAVLAPHSGFSTWQEARDALGDEFIAGPRTRTPANARSRG